jgi:hypothetical protein
MESGRGVGSATDFHRAQSVRPMAGTAPSAVASRPDLHAEAHSFHDISGKEHFIVLVEFRELGRPTPAPSLLLPVERR